MAVWRGNRNRYGRDTEFGGSSGTPQREPASQRAVDYGIRSTTAGHDVELSARQQASIIRQAGKASIDLHTPDGVAELTPLQRKYLTPEEAVRELGSVKRAIRARLMRNTNGYADTADGMSDRQV